MLMMIKNKGLKMDYTQISKIAVEALENIKGEDIKVIDTTKLSPLFNQIIICSGNSNRQVVALANSVINDFKRSGVEVVGVEGNQNGEWVLVDCGDIVIHIMLPNVRSYYNLESLWHEHN